MGSIVTTLTAKAAGIATIASGLALMACSAPIPGGDGTGIVVPDSCTTSKRPTQAYTSGWATNPAYQGFNITYPSDGGSFGGIVIITGYIVGVSGMANWGPFLASKGMATFLIDPPGAGDDPSARSRAQIAALASLRAEATRPGSPLNGKLDLNKLAIAGWSMGGGGTLHTASGNPPGVKAAIAFAPWELGASATFPGDRVPTLVLAGGGADALVNHGMSRGEYDSIFAAPKAYVEVNGADHFQWQNPVGAGNVAGLYTWAWINSWVNGASACNSIIANRAGTFADFAKSGF
jgi:dienelactone hydrolase